jgi:hypothetical protein
MIAVLISWSDHFPIPATGGDATDEISPSLQGSLCHDVSRQEHGRDKQHTTQCNEYSGTGGKLVHVTASHGILPGSICAKTTVFGCKTDDKPTHLFGPLRPRWQTGGHCLGQRSGDCRQTAARCDATCRPVVTLHWLCATTLVPAKMAKLRMPWISSCRIRACEVSYSMEYREPSRRCRDTIGMLFMTLPVIGLPFRPP